MERNYYQEIKNTDILNGKSEKEWNAVLSLVAKSDVKYRLEAYGVNHVAYEIWNCDCFASDTPQGVVNSYIDCVINYDL